MPGKIYRADHTREEIEAIFAASLTRVADAELTARAHNLRIDGTRIGGMKPRMHKQYSSHYSKEENESYAVATMLVQLNIDDEVENLTERDKPDIKVDFKDGTATYVEVRLIENGRIGRSRFVEDLNHAFLTLARRDHRLAERLATLNITLRMTFKGGLPMHQLLKEATAFVKSILTDYGKNEQVVPLYPLLHGLGARAFWSPKKYEQVGVFQDSFAQVGLGPSLSSEMRAAVTTKLAAAAGYDSACRPLWLLLEVADIMRLPSAVESDASSLFQGLTSIAPFDRIVVTAPGMAPQLFPN